MTATRVRLAGIGAALVLLAVLPLLLSDAHTLRLATVGAYLVAVLGLDLLVGQAGQVSLGQGAFMAVGGYTTAILVAHHGVRDLWTIPVAAAVAAAVGLAAGIPALRLRGSSFALATFGLAIAVPPILLRFDHFTRGRSGITLSGSRTISDADVLYALTWVVAAALFLVAWRLVASRFGRALRAVRDNERGAAAAGIGRSRYGLAAFALASAYAGVAGALLAIDAGGVRPGSFPILLSFYLLAGAVVGGLGSIWGALLGALLVEFAVDLVGAFPHVGAGQAGPATFALGALVVLLMLGVPPALRLAALVRDRVKP
jgi:branched-chain amino acid transport system permease protein